MMKAMMMATTTGAVMRDLYTNVSSMTHPGSLKPGYQIDVAILLDYQVVALTLSAILLPLQFHL